MIKRKQQGMCLYVLLPCPYVSIFLGYYPVPMCVYFHGPLYFWVITLSLCVYISRLLPFPYVCIFLGEGEIAP